MDNFLLKTVNEIVIFFKKSIKSHKMKQKHFLYLLFTLVLVIISVSVVVFPQDKFEAIKFGLDIIRTIATLITLILAVFLFDRFGLRKKIIDKQADAVILLLEELRILRINIEDPAEKAHFFLWFGRDFSYFRSDKSYSTMKNNKVYFIQGENFSIPPKINIAMENLWIPLEIKQSMNFLKINVASGIKRTGYEKLDEILIAGFGDKEQYILVTEYALTYEQFLKEYENLSKNISTWLTNHTNLENILHFDK